MQNGLEWMKLALAEPRIAALFTFGGVFGPGDNSRCSQLWEGFGKMVIAAGQDGAFRFCSGLGTGKAKNATSLAVGTGGGKGTKGRDC